MFHHSMNNKLNFLFNWSQVHFLETCTIACNNEVIYAIIGQICRPWCQTRKIKADRNTNLTTSLLCLKQFWHVHVIFDDLMKSLARHPTWLFVSLIFMQIALPDKIQTDSFVITSKDIYSWHSMVLTSKAVDY